MTGGGISFERDTLSLNNSTINANSATASSGSGISAIDSVINIANSIIANSGPGGDCNITTGAIDIDAASIIEDGSCNAQRAIDPQLGPLSDNGGATLTHALLPTSPARNTGVLSTCESQDQRGQIRNDGDDACDVGAIEFNADDEFGITEEINFIVIPLSDGRTVVVPN